MGQAKRKREARARVFAQLGVPAIADALDRVPTNYPPKVQRTIRVGVFPLPDGQKMRLEMPAGLMKQHKYDAATALAKVCKQLIEEADAMPEDGSGA